MPDSAPRRVTLSTYPQRPDFFGVRWANDHEREMVFYRLSSGGYIYKCPQGNHRAYCFLDTDSGTRHTLTFDNHRRATIGGSLLCPQGCGWHVNIRDGEVSNA